MKKFIFAITFCVEIAVANAQTISSTTYPFSVATGIAPEDMSSGTTLLQGSAADNNTTALLNIGFDFWYGGTRYTQYSLSSNGYIRLGALISGAGTATDITNSLGSFNQTPCVAPYWDDIRTGVTTGKVHTKIFGTAPNRKLVVEWFDMEIPKFDNSILRNFQLWLSETTGKIEFVYGKGSIGIPQNSNNGGASIGFNRTNTSFASVTSATSTVSYSVATNSNLSAIDAGTRYSFTPIIPNAPTNLTFNNVTGTSMSVGWTDNATDEIGYAVYRSDDGGNTYQFLTQTAANTVSYFQTLLTPGTTYFWKIVAVTDGGVSTALEGSQATVSLTAVTSNGTGGGNWSNTATWAGGVVPTDANNVVIKDGDLVTIDGAANTYDLQIGEGNSGALQFESTTARMLTVYNHLEVKPGAALQTSGSGAVTTHIVNAYGNVLNGGIINLAAGTTGASLRFLGANNASFSGTGITTNLYSLTIGKLTVSQLVEMNLSNFSVRGVSTNATTGFLTLSVGTLKISGNNTFSGTLTSSAPFSLGSATYLWVNNPNFTILLMAV
jgi:Fibronectin type III domain